MEIKNKKTGNSSLGSSIIADICIVIYVFALVQGAVRIYLSIDERKKTAEQEFSNIANIAMNVGNQGFRNERFINIINNSLTSTKSLEALIITGPDGGNAFEKRQGYAISWVNDSPRFKNKFYFLNENLYKPLPISDVRNANIKGIANAFDYAGFVKIMKETLFVILIGFAISFFTLLIQSLTGKVPKTESSFVPIKSDKSSRVIRKIELSSAPKGLYSSRSGIGWEDYLKDRLDSELHRCSSSEKDLALLIMDFTDIGEERVYRQAAEEAVTFFTSRDLLFEFGECGITVILPGTGFETAVAMSEKFYKRITERFPKSYSEAYGLCIGLSTRSGRLCNANRLILEAMEALKKAKTDSKTSIIAFKSDPNKYREFIASQN